MESNLYTTDFKGGQSFGERQALAIVAAFVLAFVPRLPSANASNGLNLATGSVRITSSTSRRQRIFPVTQIAASFVLLAGASTLITTLIALQAAQTGLDTRHVLAIDVPAMNYGKTPEQVVDFYKEAIRRIDALPGVSGTAFGMVAPWRDADIYGIGLQFSGDGHVHSSDDPRAMWRFISPGFFAALGAPILDGRDFNALDGPNNEPVVIVSATLARRMFPNGDAVGRHVYWTDPVIQFSADSEQEKARFKSPHRVIGVASDIDDEHVVPEPTSTIYGSFADTDSPSYGGHLQSVPFSLAQGDSLRFQWGPRPSMKADISTLHKPDILILQRQGQHRSCIERTRGVRCSDRISNRKFW